MLILASKSLVRQRLLKDAGLAFEVGSSPLDEEQHKTTLADQSPATMATELAKAKALALSTQRPDDTIIGADQTLAFNGHTIHKCATLPEAHALLRQLSGHTHTLHSAVAVARRGSLIFSHQTTVQMTMRRTSEAFLTAYLEAEGPELLGSVGCYHFEGRGIQLFETVEGDYHAILGLPLLPLLAFLREIGELET